MTDEQAAAQRRGFLHQELEKQIELHGVTDVLWMLGVILDDRGLVPVQDDEPGRDGHVVELGKLKVLDDLEIRAWQHARAR